MFGYHNNLYYSNQHSNDILFEQKHFYSNNIVVIQNQKKIKKNWSSVSLTSSTYS